eukprot:m.289867 g.289867  ORF g.289867 m.289867 type:complete len:104 (-) comp15810_c1_seq1:1681-1992(-)
MVQLIFATPTAASPHHTVVQKRICLFMNRSQPFIPQTSSRFDHHRRTPPHPSLPPPERPLTDRLHDFTLPPPNQQSVCYGGHCFAVIAARCLSRRSQLHLQQT